MMSGDVFSSTNPQPQALSNILPHQVLEPNPSSRPSPSPNPNPNPTKKRRNLPGTPDPEAEVIALSPKTLMATNRFVCEICNKGFQRDQNLQLHRRGHNLPWKLKQRANKDQIKKKVYICPEKTCVHHEPGRALGDLTGIKKHFSRKHGEKKWKCEKCSKKYAVQSDWKAHSKTCGTREYKCDCGTLFSRKDSFITHRAFCDALAEESARFTNVGSNSLNFRNHDLVINNSNNNNNLNIINNNNLMGGFTNPNLTGGFRPPDFGGMLAGSPILGGDHHQNHKPSLPLWLNQQTNPHLSHLDQCSNLFMAHDMMQMASPNNLFGSAQSIGTYSNISLSPLQAMKEEPLMSTKMAGQSLASSLYSSENSGQNHQPPPQSPAAMSATALLQKAAQMGSTKSGPGFFGNTVGVMNSSSSPSSSSTNTLPFGAPGARSELNQVFGPAMDGFDGGPVGRAPGGQIGGSLHGGAEHGGLTRDFLGMGGGEGGAGGPFSQQDLAKFVSMSSAMGLGGHFAGDR